MRIKLLVIPALLSSSLFAITIDEAINKAVKNNLNIKSAIINSQISKSDFEISKSTLKPSLDLTLSNLQNNNTNLSIPKSVTTFGIVGTYNLFRGYIDQNKISSSEEIFKAQEHTKKSLEEDIKLLTKVRYFKFLQAKENLEVAQESVALFKKQLKDNKAFFEQGVIAKNEVLSVEVNLANSIQEELLAQSKLKIAKKELENVIDSDIDTKVEAFEYFLNNKPNIEKLKVLLLQNRSEIKYLDSLLKTNQYLIEISKGSNLPTIDLMAKHEEYSYDNFSQGIDKQTSLLVSAKWNLFSGGAIDEKIQKSKLEYLKTDNQKATLLKDLDLQLTKTYEEYLLLDSALEVSKSALALANENYNIIQKRYSQQISSITEFLSAKLDLTKAKNQLINNRYNKSIAIANLQRVIEHDLK